MLRRYFHHDQKLEQEMISNEVDMLRKHSTVPKKRIFKNGFMDKKNAT